MKTLYYYDPEVGNFFYGQGHPMKPHRMRMAHSLIESYGLLPRLDVRSYADSGVESDDYFTQFHSDDYIDFLSRVTPGNQAELADLTIGFNMGEDCPVFEGLWDFCKIYTAGSIMGATAINEGKYTRAINWSGGLHHAKETEASGFCYINDCVLSIIELLRCHTRVLYLDIDIHHGDGVEEAFYNTDRVLTCSFHKFGNYFPDTGNFNDSGYGAGDGHCVNFPLLEGMDDEHYSKVFEPIMETVMSCYRPEAIVMQCGADSISGDRLGCFNLSVKGHGTCVEFMKKFNVPMLVLGGGGYTLRNVARCWTYETSVLADTEIPNEIPVDDDFRGYYGPEFKLHSSISNMENMNTKEYLRRNTENIIARIKEKVRPVGPQLSAYTSDTVSGTVNSRYSAEARKVRREREMDLDPERRED